MKPPLKNTIEKSFFKFQRLLSNLLNLGTDFKENVSLLVRSCGELLGADVCMYNRLDGEMIATVSGWKLPANFKKIDKAEGHLCYDVIKKTIPGKPLIIKNLPNTEYYKTDPNVKKFSLKTYIGFPVEYAGRINGSLCLVYKNNVDFTSDDIQIIKLNATLIGIEEERQNLNEKLYKRIKFEEMISSLASRFISLSYDQTDEMINSALKEIGEFCGVDRSYIFLAYDRGRKVRNTHEWCAEGIEPLIDKLKELKAKDFEWFAEKIKNKQAVCVSHRDLLPKAAEPLKRLLYSQKVISLLCVPLIYAGQVIGFVGFDAVKKPKEWEERDIVILKLAGEIFASAIMGKKLQQKIMRTNIKIKEFCLKDPLTGLYNQGYYEEVIEREFQRARRQALLLSILMLDLDYFKSINELYGFRFGDLILVQLANKINKLVRKYDIVIRYSGEEFIIIAPGIDREQALGLAKRILEKINRYKFGNHQQKIKIKLSIAVVSYPDDPLIKSREMVEWAEKLLLKAKEKGGNIVISSLDLQDSKSLYLRKYSISKEINKFRNYIERITHKVNQIFMDSLYAFAKTIEAKDQYTGEHVEKTVYYAVEIARRFSLPPKEIEYIRQAAILHDLGKIGVSEKILLKRKRLSPLEFREIKRHPRIGAEILRTVHLFRPVIPIVLSHHERWDGKGYPNGLKKEEIPLGARILAVADAFQALISKRPYRRAYSVEEAIEIIKKGRATQFDPRVVDTFLDIFKESKKTSLNR